MEWYDWLVYSCAAVLIVIFIVGVIMIILNEDEDI